MTSILVRGNFLSTSSKQNPSAHTLPSPMSKTSKKIEALCSGTFNTIE
ncbi:hypothetical protein L2D08_13215 [Domibacillus sp. PGB-M46]|nr:hypothetical protein [Domibacillus sp. PGB-M46]MCI2255327.1 hypothetical protein [Domibacillus sp. PGB-M46]